MTSLALLLEVVENVVLHSINSVGLRGLPRGFLGLPLAATTLLRWEERIGEVRSAWLFHRLGWVGSVGDDFISFIVFFLLPINSIQLHTILKP